MFGATGRCHVPALAPVTDSPPPFPFRYKALALAATIGFSAALWFVGTTLAFDTILPRFGRRPYGGSDDRFYLWVVIILFVGGPSALQAVWSFVKEMIAMSQSVARGEEFDDYDKQLKTKESALATPSGWRLKIDSLFDLALLLIAPQAWFFFTDRGIASSWKQFAIETGWVLLWMLALFLFAFPPLIVLTRMVEKWKAHGNDASSEASDEEE